MLSRMSAAEVADWQAYERVTGSLGPERDDHLSTLVAFYVVKALGSKRVKLSDLMPRWQRPEPMGWEAMKMMAEAITRQHGGEVR